MDNHYRKKPVIVSAVQWTGMNHEEIESFTDPMSFWFQAEGDTRSLGIRTLEGKLYAAPGDWIICGVHGEVYPCKPDIFEATYEKVNYP